MPKVKLLLRLLNKTYVVAFEELGNTYAQVEQQVFVLHFSISRAHTLLEMLESLNGLAWSHELPLTDLFLLTL